MMMTENNITYYFFQVGPKETHEVDYIAYLKLYQSFLSEKDISKLIDIHHALDTFAFILHLFSLL